MKNMFNVMNNMNSIYNKYFNEIYNYQWYIFTVMMMTLVGIHSCLLNNMVLCIQTGVIFVIVETYFLSKKLVS